jgi:hypothetical protein
MKPGILVAVLLSWGLVAVQSFSAQAPPAPSQPSANQKPATPSKPPAQSNPFPEDTNNVPVLPSGEAPAQPGAPPDAASSSGLSKGDVDPVRSPDDPVSDSAGDAEGFSSSSSGLDKLVPPAEPDAPTGKRGRRNAPTEHQESAADDEKVGEYYLSNKNWRAALSRYESAVVLDPENPEVYWGLGEAQRHLGKFAEAKASYGKLIEYDPDSKHGKDAQKLMKDPQLANAPTASAAKP